MDFASTTIGAGWLMLLDKLTRVYVVNFGVLFMGFSTALLALAACLVVECGVLGWSHSSLRRLVRNRTRDTHIDIVSFLLVQWSLDPLLYAAMSLGAIPLIKAAAPRLFPYRLDLTFLPTPCALLVYLLLIDFLAYWVHRLHHEIPCLWQLHKFHHSATEFNMLTVTRDHPMERGCNQLLIYLPLAFVQVENQLPLWLSGGLSAYGMFKHSMVPWNWGWIGRYVLQSPVNHRIHYSFLQEHHDLNYGNMFGCWDHLFGTFYHGSTINTAVGVIPDDAHGRGFLARLWIHYFRFLGDAFGAIIPTPRRASPPVSAPAGSEVRSKAA